MHFEVVRQISIALENHPGALHRAAAELARNGINILGLSVVDDRERGVVRLRTSDAIAAREVLNAIGLQPAETEVLEFELPDQPGRLTDVCRAMTIGEVNIDYAYGTSNEAAKRMRVLLRATPLARAKQILAELPGE